MKDSSSMKIKSTTHQVEFGGYWFSISRPHSFGLVIDGPPVDGSTDYLHDLLLSSDHREAFMALIETEGLVVCKNLVTAASTYRKVRGKSSFGKLSQAEYYHHDGCRCPTKPRVVEIRLPHQDVARNVATAIAPFPNVIRAMLQALPERLQDHAEIVEFRSAFMGEPQTFPQVQTWDQVQGKTTRLVRREMDAESCRAYFRDVDQLADAYALPWEMGESRLMLNNHDDLSQTMQHRRAYQKTREALEQNGSLVKRWTAEEVGSCAMAPQKS
jgi:hypothetical protein